MSSILFLIISLLNHSESGTNYYYALSPIDLLNGSVGPLRADRVVEINHLFAGEFKAVIRYLVPLSLVLFLCVGVLSFVFLKLLKKIKEEENDFIAAKIRNMDFNALGNLNHSEESSYSKIKESIESNLNDYKRLHNYLSHEQKNILALVRLQGERKQDTDLIHHIDTLTDGINDILTISESLEDQTLYPVDISLVAAEVSDIYKKIYPQISFSFDEDANYEVLTKTRWVFRAISNLVDNAIKYGNNQNVEINLMSQHGSVIVQVKDHGDGIEKSKLSTIFNYQYRVNELKQDVIYLLFLERLVINAYHS